MTFSIGKVSIPSSVVLAPMAGVTDSAFRRLSKRFGIGLIYTELISSIGFVHKDKKTFELAKFHPEERPVAIQIFGSRPYEMSLAAKMIENQLNPDILDINLGCSVPKMGKSGGGAFLCRDIPLLNKILDSVRKAVSMPVTIKIRMGWDNNEITMFEIGKLAESIGIDAIAIHGRTSKQGYSGYADWNTIKQLKSSVSIPVIGNGDIMNHSDALLRMDESVCDAIMVGRGAMGNPWIFREINAALDKKSVPSPPTLWEREKLILEHLAMIVEEKGFHGILEMRRHIGWYIKGLPNSSLWRQQLVHAKTADEMTSLVKRYFLQLQTDKPAQIKALNGFI